MGQNQISINATMPFSFKPCYNKDLKENGGRGEESNRPIYSRRQARFEFTLKPIPKDFEVYWKKPSFFIRICLCCQVSLASSNIPNAKTYINLN